MSEKTRIVWLIVVMMTAVAVSTLVAISVLYDTAFEQTRSHLIQTAEDQAHLIKAVAAFDQRHYSGGDTTTEAATLSQIETAFDHYNSEGQIAEIAVAQSVGDQIVYRVTHGRVIDEKADPIPDDSHLAEPMRRALSGRSGAMIGLDYRGVEVLAAYQPVPLLNAGVVAKMDIAVIKAPFIRGGALAIVLALFLITVGAAFFVRLTNPMVRRLTDTEERYRRIFRGAPVPIWEQDMSGVHQALTKLRASGVKELGPYLSENPDAASQLIARTRIGEVNAAALALFGARTVEEFQFWFDSKLIPARPGYLVTWLEAIWTGREVPLTRRIDLGTLDGEVRSLMLSIVVPRAEHGYRSVTASALDVTAHAVLRQRERQLQLIMESTGEGIFGLDREGKCNFINAAAVRMLGFPDDRALLGRDMHALIHRRDHYSPPLSSADCPICHACDRNSAASLDNAVLWRADGSSFPAECRAYPMIRDGVAVGSVVTFTDITERKEREAALLQAQKMEVVAQLTGAVAHDFNNLIAIILANLRYLEQYLGSAADAEVAELIADAESAAQDGSSLIRRLLAFARKQPLEPRRMDLNAFIEHTYRFLRRLTGAKIELVLRQEDGELPVQVDRQQLESAVLNLVMNAKDAMPEGGTLTIETRREHVEEGAKSPTGLTPGPYFVVSVRDAGVGMSPELLERAVEPFYSTKQMGKGGGLGLSAALGFAQQCGGDLKISSTPGRGTTVELYLPAAPSAGTAGAGDTEAATVTGRLSAAGRTATILVVDDDQVARGIAKRTLANLGYEVIEVDSADAAKRLLAKGTGVDLLFSDVIMPGEMDGLQLARWVRQHCPGVRVLLTSGSAQALSGVHGEDGGERPPLLQKPYSQEQLDEAVRARLHAEAT